MRIYTAAKKTQIRHNESKGSLAISGNTAVTGTLAVSGASTLTGATTQTGALTCASTIITAGASGEALTYTKVTGTTGELASGADYTFTDMIPAGVILLAVVARVTKAVTGPTSWMLGVTGDTDLWGATNANTVNTVVKGTVTATATAYAKYNAAALSVIVTRGSASDFTAGNIRVTVFYIDVTGPTS